MKFFLIVGLVLLVTVIACEVPSAYCGDGTCNPGEKGVCILDCTIEPPCVTDADCAIGETCQDGDCVVTESACAALHDYNGDGACDGKDKAFLASIASLDTLRDAADANGILIGALGDLDFIVNEEYATNHKNVLANEFNLLISNGWYRFLLPEEGKFNSAPLQKSIAFAKDHDMMLSTMSAIYTNRGTPDWMHFWNYTTGHTTPDCGGWNESEENRTHLASIMEAYLTQYAAALGDNLFLFKVVNEPLRTDGVVWPYNCWNKVFGEKYIDMAFSYAKAAAPQAKLMLNENFGRANDNEAMFDGYLALLGRLKSRDVPVDVAGIEMHLRADLLADNWTLLLDRFFNETAKLGLDSAITEMDVSWDSDWDEPAPLEREKEIYKQAIDACLEHERCIAFMTWGLSDRRSWLLSGTGINVGLNDSEPLLFDSDFNKKPAYYGVLESLKEHACGEKRCDVNGDGTIDAKDVSVYESFQQ